MRSKNELQDLLTQARQGAPGAAGRLRDELAPELERIVRRALRSDTPRTTLTRHIRAHARSASGPAWESDVSCQGFMVAEVAGGVAATVERRLRMAGASRDPLRETIRGL